VREENMKNYLVKSLYKINDPNWQVLDRSHESDLYSSYLKLHDISLSSFEQHLQGEWELKFLTGQVSNVNEAFEKTFWAIHDLWHQEPCNILYTDPDTLAVRSVEMFDRFDQFMMFNFTDPRSFDKDGVVFENFFNAGVRYFPNTMKEETWQLGTAMARAWDHNTYDTEQVILNTMLWAQGIELAQAWRPSLNWTAMNLRDLDPSRIAGHSMWNQFPFESSQIIHFHGSRGAEATRQIMEFLRYRVVFND
jgi:hypothetical protein